MFPLPEGRETAKFLAPFIGWFSHGEDQDGPTVYPRASLPVPPKMFQAGDSIESKCTRCKELRDHAVVVVVDGEIGKVQCKVCGSVHKHRSSSVKPKKTSKAVATRSAKALKEVQEATAQWEKAVDGHNTKNVKPFGAADSAVVGSFINHPKFGLGLVESLVAPSKMEVLFKSGRKLMVRNL